MAEKEMVSAKVASRTKDRLDEYADKEGISRSQAIGRILKQGLDVEESDMRLVPVRSDGGTIIEDRLDEIEQKQIQEIEETQTAVRDVSQDIDELSEYASKLGRPLLLSLVWIFVEVAVGIPNTTVMVASGLAVVLWLAVSLWRLEQ
jgi:antitoxin component of RelBE/YafQ-DinJ toxin-antitoxin module